MKDGDFPPVSGARNLPENGLLLKKKSPVIDIIPQNGIESNGSFELKEKEETGFHADSSERQDKPPNGYYRWIVVVAAFFCSFIVDGIASSFFAVYSIEFEQLYPDQSSKKVSWIGSLLYGVYLLMGPISCGLAETFGYRNVIFSGSVVAAAGFFCSCFVPHIDYLFLTFSVIGGIGFGLMYSPSIMCVCSYFKEENALAVGVAVCGSSVGGMVVPLIVLTIVERFGWHGSMLFLAGLALQGCIAAAVMRTPQCLHALPDQSNAKSCLPPKIRQALFEMTDLKVYLIPTFLAYSLASFIGSVAFLTPSFFLPGFARQAYPAVDELASMTSLTAVACAGIFGRVMFGWLADRLPCEPLVLHNACILTAGVALVTVPVCGSFAVLLGVTVIYGFFIAPYISLMSAVLSSRLGLNQLPSAFGQTQLVAGIASIVGPPLHDTLGEVYASKGVPFYYGGGAWILAALIASVIFLFPKTQPVKGGTGSVANRTGATDSLLQTV